MGRPRYQHPAVLKTKSKRPRWYVRVMVDVLVDRNKIGRKEQPIYLGLCDEMGKREAEKLRDEKLKTVNNTPLVIQSQVKFSDLAEVYRTTYLRGLKPSTRTSHEHRLLKYIVPKFGALPLFEIDPPRVQQWVFEMEDNGLARSTRRTILAVLRSVFEVAEEWGYYVGRNPCKKTKLGGGGEVFDRRALEPAECLRLLTGLEGDEPLKTILEVALYTGLRASEILGLTWGSLDTKRGVLTVKQARSQQGELSDPKSLAGRRGIKKIGSLVKRFQRPPDVKDNDLIWAGEDYFVLQDRLRRRSAKLGIGFKGFGFHTLRRTYATFRDLLGAATTPDAALVKDMGHSDARMTEHYIQEDRSDIADRLRNLIYFSGDSGESGNVN